MNGNGCPGSNASGVRTGQISREKYAPRNSRICGVHASRLEKRDVLGRQQLAQLVPARCLVLELLPGARAHRISCCSVLYPSGATSSIPSRSFFSVVATRIMKNSSRFVPTIDEELHALEQRMRGIVRLGEHALVELEPAQLAVDVQRRVLEIGRIDLRVGGARGNNPQRRLGARRRT